MTQTDDDYSAFRERIKNKSSAELEAMLEALDREQERITKQGRLICAQLPATICREFENGTLVQ